MDEKQKEIIQGLVIKYWSKMNTELFPKGNPKKSVDAFFKLKTIYEVSNALGYDVEAEFKANLKAIKEN